MTRRDLLIGASVAAALPLLAGHGMAAGTAAVAAEARVHTVVMGSMRFGPVPPGIRAGDVILWVNRDVVPHTATARDGSFDVNVPARQSRRMTVRRAGSFAFYCKYHPGMRGALVAAR